MIGIASGRFDDPDSFVSVMGQRVVLRQGLEALHDPMLTSRG
jgi:hypothetical protein